MLLVGTQLAQQDLAEIFKTGNGGRNALVYGAWAFLIFNLRYL